MSNNLLKSVVLAALLFAFAAPSVIAQDEEEVSIAHLKSRHEISLNFFEPGIGSVAYSGNYDWKNPLGVTVGFGMTYNYWFTRHFGINTGLNFSYMYHKETLESVYSECRGSLSFVGPRGVEYKETSMTVMTPNINENQAIFMLEVPVQLSFEATHLFGNVGVSFATPITTYGSYTYDASKYEIYKVDGLGVELENVIEAEVIDGNAGSYHPADVKRPFFWTLSADLGWKFFFDNSNSVALSVYCNYAMNSCKLDDSVFDLIDVANDRTSARPPLETGLVQEYTYFNAGIRVAYHIGVGKHFLQ